MRFGNFRGVGAGALRADIQHARRRTGSIRVVSLQACCLMIINDAKIMNASPKKDNLCAGLYMKDEKQNQFINQDRKGLTAV